MKISVIIPTFNPDHEFEVAIRMLEENLASFKNAISEIIIVDSGSKNGGIEFLKEKNIKLIRINSRDFNHGGTRNMAANRASGDIIVFMTQDAILFNERSIANLVSPLIIHKEIGMAYGRQLPKRDADFFGKFAREFNYPEKSTIKSLKDINKLGIKTIFVSNSFAAYKKDLLNRVGGFPLHTILGEDTCVAAKMINEGFSIAYVADAQVYHSHNYTILQEFHRYFDTGVFHKQENWILKEFSAPESEGQKFIKMQLKALVSLHKYYLIPNFILRNGMKYLGYKLGFLEKYIPINIKRNLSMQRTFWRK
ncbi:glycosyltransferase family 2 protein [Sporolactobacillus shoreae]|uniref:Glycosyltransferase family 2 protein n=1 Tax=Sporolactobacillus shoreae TaxID=1465501 RepID=A0A4Z0GSZ2_9BACL|nr:glycosyltransferase [Sporolactobacillus shoreae]TGA99821.1 glycosyltransferase family 2 protein [Sporolactobacillus shoreae]